MTLFGSDHALFVFWNCNEMVRNTKVVMSRQVRRAGYVFAQLVRLWPRHVVVCTPSASLWGLDPRFGLIAQAATATLIAAGVNVVNGVRHYESLQLVTGSGIWHPSCTDFMTHVIVLPPWKKRRLRGRASILSTIPRSADAPTPLTQGSLDALRQFWESLGRPQRPLPPPCPPGVEVCPHRPWL